MKTILLIIIAILYGIEIILHEKDKKKLKEYERRFGGE